MNHDLIVIDPNILNGTPVFAGTRVPVSILFDHLESGISLEEFLDDYPTVERSQAVRILEAANKLITSRNFKELYEIAS